jgi:hypothetical protein
MKTSDVLSSPGRRPGKAMLPLAGRSRTTYPAAPKRSLAGQDSDD